jgi:hypothetical protein
MELGEQFYEAITKFPVPLDMRTLKALKGAHSFGTKNNDPFHERNTTENAGKIRDFRPPYVWMKTFVFCTVLTVDSWIVVSCTLATGAP